jgi:hypothetical protein
MLMIEFILMCLLYIYVNMEQYLKDLKSNKDGTYTLPKNKYDELFEKYHKMKKELAECALNKEDYLYAKKKHQENEVLLLQLERNKNMEIMLLKKQIKEMSESMAHFEKIADETMALLKAERAKNAALELQKTKLIRHTENVLALYNSEKTQNEGK